MPEEDVKTVVTKREGVTSETVSSPGGGTVETIAMPWWRIVLVRTARVYVQGVFGFLTAAATGYAAKVGVNLGANDFVGLLQVSLSLAVAPAAFTLLQNIGELLANLDEKHPTLRA